MSDLSLKDTLDVIQLTDTHIFSDIKEEFDGINTFYSLKQILNHVKQSSPAPDLILLTGDLVHDTEQQAYLNLVSALKDANVQVFSLPGNHDEPELMNSVLTSAGIGTCRLIMLNKWIIFMLDSFLPGTHSGELGDAELYFLDSMLNKNRNRHALVCLHHPPVSVNSSWMDSMRLKNPEALWSVLDRYESVKGVLWGHIHQEFSGKRDSMKLMASPSTCVQFTPRSDHYVKDSRLPGYRRLRLGNDGTIDTKVIRVSLAES